MEYFLKTLSDRMKKYPDRISFKNGRCNRGITYKETEDYTGRVYNYLKSKGIGKEDFVLICLPRGVRPFMAMIGTWKAGAALTVVESTYPPERIEYIKNDVGAKLVINEEVYNEMMTYDYLEGYVEADDHDACFAIYTSGSTGNPKGVLHEYGKLKMIINSQSDKRLGYKYSFANIAPLNFIATIGLCFVKFMSGYTVHIIPYSITKNPPEYIRYLKENGITHIFGTPSYLKIFTNFPDCVEVILSGGEPLSNLYFPGKELINLYSCSETSFSLAVFKVDKKYDVAPVGKSFLKYNFEILDENGNPVKKGEKGEICIRNDFTRGYINLPESTKEVFVNGIYHTHDIGYLNEDENLVISGRVDDMIKIDGNRIEPGEIEVAVSKLFGLKKVVAKGFVSKRNSYVAVYYLKSDALSTGNANPEGYLKIDINKINEELLKRLPYYMLPSYYVGLDAFPVNANGKITRKSLQAPEICPSTEYVAPRNQIEEKICKAFSKVLNCKMGINDDFYTCGGDSLASISFISECNLKGISISDLFKCHTAAKLAELYMNIQENSVDVDAINSQCLKEKMPLLVEQLTILDFQFLHCYSTMWNLSCLFKLKPDIDLKRLANSIKKAIFAHPVFLTVFDANEDCDFVQYYDESIFKEIEITKTTEKELGEIKKNLIRPMKLFKSCLYRCNIFKTEANSYLFLDFHHILADGTSLKILRKDIAGFYNDDNYKAQNDYYYYALYENKVFPQTEKYKEAIEYYKQFDDSQYRGGIAFDYKDKGFNMGYYSILADIPNKVFDNSSLCKDIGKNGLFAIASAIAELIYGNCKKVQVNWLNNGRDTTFKMNVCGLMYKVTRLYFDFNKYSTVREMYDDLKYQLHGTIAYGLFPRINQRWVAGEENIGVFYQKGIYEIGSFGQLVSDIIDLPTPYNASDAAFDYEMIDCAEGTELRCQYSASNYKESTVKVVTAYIEKAMKLLLKYEDNQNMNVDEIIKEIRGGN